MSRRITSILASQTDDPLYSGVALSAGFTGVVPEWEMQFGQIEPTQGVFNWVQCDKIVNWAVAHGLEVDGHSLVWDATGYSGLMPGWITNGTWTRTTLLAALQNHITTIVNRYKDRIHTWRVVNEAFEDNGTRTAWVVQTVIGNDWIEQCFNFAHAADPTAKLYYNEYNIEWGHFGGNAKYTAVKAMVQDFKARSIPIDGVGFQCHLDTQYYNYTTHVPTFPDPADFPAVLADFKALGVTVDVTEMDIRRDNTSQSTIEEDRAQVDIANLVIKSVDGAGGRGVAIWGISDATSWLGAAAQGAPWDTLYQAKPYAFALMAGFEDTRTWWPDGYDDPAFQVQRQLFGAAHGGDYVRGSAVRNLPHTAVRYPSSGSLDRSAVGTRSILHVRPVNRSTVQIEWGWPPAPNDTWLEVSLVRSAFGRPSTVNDGQTIYRQPRATFLRDDGTFIVPPILQDGSLPGGRWYHYALFFKATPKEWVRGMVDSCLLPRDLLHSTYLWENVPPYYRWVDSQSAQQTGFLQQFLNVFGFELDNEREFIESWQHLYDIDWSPIRLLRQLGPNFGIAYESGLGDIRFRSMMTNIGYLYKTRGTTPSLELLVANMSKYQCSVSTGVSLMLQPDDSDFYQSTGSWAGIHPDTADDVVPPPPSSVRLTGAAGTHIQGPDIAAIAGAKTFTVEVDAAADSWSTAAGVLAAQTVSGNSSWVLTLPGTGAVAFSAYGDGVNPLNYTSGLLGLAALSRHKIKATWTAVSGANSTVQFAVDGVNVGAPVTAATLPGGLFNSTTTIRLGNTGNDNTRFTGNIYGATITAPIGQTVAMPTFTRMAAGQNTVLDAVGTSWVMQGAATVANPISPIPTLLPAPQVFLSKTAVGEVTPSKGRGAMKVWTSAADALKQLAVDVGDGIRYPGNDADPNTARTILPSAYGIPVTPGVSYGFSVSIRAGATPLMPEPFLMFFDQRGNPMTPLSVVRSTNPKGISDTANWYDYFYEGQAPAKSVFLVPGILFSSRPAVVGGALVSPNIYICGVLVYVAGEIGTVLALPPDRYLTVGDPGEKIGTAKTGFDPFLLGTPRPRS